MKIVILCKKSYDIFWVFFARPFDLWSGWLLVLVAAHSATVHRPTTTPNTKQFMYKHRNLSNLFKLKGEVFVKILLLFRRDLAGFDLWSFVSSVRDASYLEN